MKYKKRIRMMFAAAVIFLLLRVIGTDSVDSGKAPQPSGIKRKKKTPDTKGVIDFTAMDAREAYEAMVRFMTDPSAVAGTYVKLRGTVSSMEYYGGRKWYSVNLPGGDGYESGPHFMIEGFGNEDYPVTRTAIEISGIFDAPEDLADPTFDDYCVTVKPENYINLNKVYADSVSIPDREVSKTDTPVFEVKYTKLAYTGMRDNKIMFHAENSSGIKVMLRSVDVMFNGIPVTDGFWIPLQTGEAKDTHITVFPVTLEKTGIMKLETVSFRIELIDEYSAKFQTEVITVRLPE